MSASWRRLLAAAVLATSAFPRSVAAQAKGEVTLETITGPLKGGPKDLLRQTWQGLLEHPETLNGAMDRLFAGDRWQLLRDLNLRFLTFEAEGSDVRGLGLGYAYVKSVKRDDLIDRGTHHVGLDFSLDASGNVSFTRNINPRDFLQAHGNLSLSRSRGGAVATTPEVQARLAVLRDSLALITDQAALDRSPLWGEYLATVAPHLTTQLYLELGASTAVESDQSFGQAQFVYAARLGLDLKAWNRGSRLAQWNVFDWPFALIRYLSGTDPRFIPRGSSIPTVRMELGLVDPTRNDGREAAGETGSFPRFALEGAMKNLVVRTGAGDFFVESDFRWYRELGPAPAIRAAGLDEFTYFALGLVSSEGPYVSYSTGRLPFDARSDQVYELGFKLHF